MSKFLEHHYRLVLLAILAFAFLTRLYRVELPQRYVFDEVYHAVTAKLINQNHIWAYEWWNPPPEPETAVDWLHPPLAKYTQALGMRVFGENSFGWRISSVVFGVFVVLVTYLLAEELFGRKVVSLLAATLASLDGLLLVQSRIAMNDIHVTFLILLTLLLYLRYVKKRSALLVKKVKFTDNWRSLTLGILCVALSAGLALGSKWSGAFVVMIVVVSEVALWVKSLWETSQTHPVTTDRIFISNFLILTIIPVVIYVGMYAHMFAQGKSLICNQTEEIQGVCYKEEFKFDGQVWYRGYVSHFVELHHQIWWYQTNLEATHPYQSRPWQWFLNLKPVWYHVEYHQDKTVSNIYALGNPALFWMGDVAIIFSLGWLIYKVVKQQKLTKDYGAILFALFSYLSVWALWELSPRIMFFYHYTPAVPLLCILLSFWLYQLGRVKKHQQVAQGAVVLSLVGIMTCFGLWYSHWTGVPVPIELRDQVFFAIKTWK